MAKAGEKAAARPEGQVTDRNPIINDPAAASNENVRVTYLRSEFEPLWLASSGGTVYLIYPPDQAVP